MKQSIMTRLSSYVESIVFVSVFFFLAWHCIFFVKQPLSCFVTVVEAANYRTCIPIMDASIGPRNVHVAQARVMYGGTLGEGNHPPYLPPMEAA